MVRMSDILEFEAKYNEMWYNKFEATIKGECLGKMKYLSFQM